jgi:hypothetical protein
VTPLRPTDWKLSFDGKAISLEPSIGNWSFACKSHYWIRNNRAEWAPRWSQQEIERGRSRDRSAKLTYFGVSEAAAAGVSKKDAVRPEAGRPQWKLWQALKKWWS